MLNPHPTRYAELNGVLHDLVTGAQAALGESFVGAYLQGSFALGAGDLHSDCDFLVVVRERPDAEQEAALRRPARRPPAPRRVLERPPRGLVRRRRRPRRPWPGWAGSGSTSTTAGRDVVVRALQPAVDPLDPARARHHARRPVPGELMEPVPDDVLREQRAGGARDAHRRRPGLVPAEHRVVPALPRRAGRPQPLHRPHREVASKRDALRWAMVHGDPGGGRCSSRCWPTATAASTREDAAAPGLAGRPRATSRRTSPPWPDWLAFRHGSRGRPQRRRPVARSSSTTRSCGSSGSWPATTPSSTPRRPTSGRRRWSPSRRRHGRTASRRRSPTRSSRGARRRAGEHDRRRRRTTPATCRRRACCPSSATAPACRARSSRSAT